MFKIKSYLLSWVQSLFFKAETLKIENTDSVNLSTEIVTNWTLNRLMLQMQPTMGPCGILRQDSLWVPEFCWSSIQPAKEQWCTWKFQWLVYPWDSWHYKMLGQSPLLAPTGQSNNLYYWRNRVTQVIKLANKKITIDITPSFQTRHQTFQKKKIIVRKFPSL